MSTASDLWETIHVLVGCLCGEGSFAHRLENAAVSIPQLSGMDTDCQEENFPPEIVKKLQYVKEWTARTSMMANS